MGIRFGIVHFDITYFTLIIVNGEKLGIDESFVWCEIQFLVTGQYLLMNVRINLHCIALNQHTGCSIVTLTLDTLDFSQQSCKELTEGFVVADTNIALTVTFLRSTSGLSKHDYACELPLSVHQAEYG